MAADLTNPFYPELVQPPRTELDSLGYRTLLLPDSAKSPVNAVQLADGSLDGVIMTTLTLGSSLPHTLAMRKIPLVLMNREADGAVADTCVLDNRDGAAKNAGLLAELRHGAVGAVFGPQNTSTGRDREIRLREGLGEHGIGLPSRMVRRGPFSYETGYHAAGELLDAPGRPTAIFCGNDAIALGAVNAAAARGLRPGKDLTITGFDDIPLASWEVFQLTTMRCNLRRMAETAVRLLTARIKDPEVPHERVVLVPELIRRSTHHWAV
ncbi:substrate-binding domain-containing protein [Streptomyces sp. DSM 41524]|uniref:Substrate-binding domain-containing protein n=1 Tax=Streptomyces asiaticus subsp. ignotus TaxID=3098222 RepID=A0ABU7Q861_9ACTN|nr:substrate-binding domain-containing protein [Streptomyces sp. DSM 41524]